uniref:SH3 domain-containing protein n=1 Tax=Hucho hucho TaxID=62062 RepID=A0A4W5LLX4_9TELE
MRLSSRTLMTLTRAALVSPRTSANCSWSNCFSQVVMVCRIPNKPMLSFRGGQIGCFTVRFSHNGRRLAAACADRDAFPIIVYEISSEKVLAAFNGYLSIVYDLCWSRDDRSLLSTSSDGTSNTPCLRKRDGPELDPASSVRPPTTFQTAAVWFPWSSVHPPVNPHLPELMRALARHSNNKGKNEQNRTFPDSLDLLRTLQSSMYTVHKDQDGPLLVFTCVCSSGFSPVGEHLGRAPSRRLQTSLSDHLSTGIRVEADSLVPVQQTVVSLYDYSAHRSDELTIPCGDVIRVLYKNNRWFGLLANRQHGYFPATYVVEERK